MLKIVKANYSLKPLQLSLAASRRLRLVLPGAGMAAGALTLAWPLWIGMPVLLLVCVMTWRAVRRYALLLGQEAVVALSVAATGELRVQLAGGGWHDAAVLGTSSVTPWGVILNLRLAGVRGVRHMLIMPDALPADDFRRLRVWLRWGELTGA